MTGAVQPAMTPPQPPRPTPLPSAPPTEATLHEWEHLVWYVVNRIRPRLPFSVSEDELYSAGMFGLLKACRSYDPSRGAVFKTYAYHRIRGAILDELRRLDFLPRAMRDRAREAGEECPAIVALPRDEDGHETVAGREGGGGEEEVEQRDLMDRLAREIAALPERMRLVMELYHGEGLKMREIGDRLRLTESRVSQIHAQAVRLLRQRLGRVGGA